MESTELEYSDEKSHKFWRIEWEGVDCTVTYGRIGTDGQSKTKSFDDEAAAKANYEKQIAGKKKKGYVAVEAGGAEASATKNAGAEKKATGGKKAMTGAGSAASTPANDGSGDDGFRDVEDGETVEMQGSGSKPYRIRNVGGVYSCSCPAWRNQSKPIERRTCKHIRRLRGDAAEEERLGGDFEIVRASKSKTKKDGPPILLAESWDGSQNVKGWWISEKLDGVRAYWDGTKFLSRQGNEYRAPDWFVEGLPAEPLDGELWLDRGKFQRAVSIVRRQDQSDHWKEISYVVFDAPTKAGGFEERMEHVETLLATSADWVRVLEQKECEGEEQLQKELARVEGLGGEGLMLRKPKSTYHVGRSSTLLKVKSFYDAEAEVIGHEPGKGKHKGRLGALLLKMDNGKTFSVGTGFTDKERENPPEIGSVITYRFQELTDAGVPRFPSFLRAREDV